MPARSRAVACVVSVLALLTVPVDGTIRFATFNVPDRPFAGTGARMEPLQESIP